MEWFDQLFERYPSSRYLVLFIAFAVIFLILVFLLNALSKKLQKRAQKTKSPIDDIIIRMVRLPALWLIFSTLLSTFSTYLKEDAQIFETLQKISQILLILIIGWVLIQTIRAIFRYFRNKLNIENANNLEARKRLTQLSMIEKITIISVSVIFISIALMSIESLRSIGVSILTSAGVIGVVVGLAAQRSVGQVLSGVQIAFTQPIRLDDVVVIEGEWGRIEEINITYAVVKIWDERRLIVPIDYFLQKPIQNWTRNTSNILGSVFLYVSYDLPVEPLREKLKTLVEANPNWDGRVQNIQITDAKQWYKELRILVSSSDSSKNWDLRVDIREKMIDFINEKYPDSFAKIYLKPQSPEKEIMAE
ncbi:MAG: putative mechanosensitive channel [Methermicoccus sp.]|nr:putative mechanosensitive channel [Methermicoccus sp.]